MLFCSSEIMFLSFADRKNFRSVVIHICACRLWVCNKIRRSLGAESRPIKFAKLKSNYSGLWIRDKGGRRTRENERVRERGGKEEGEREREFLSELRRDRITDSTWQRPLVPYSQGLAEEAAYADAILYRVVVLYLLLFFFSNKELDFYFLNRTC